ncbi:MAG TPA: hypothetical protein DCX22_03950 [Dehalococcoidia bacterium]|nr:hypothetical protein [Dehalococcoidia bacterium]
MYWANFLHIYQPPTQTEEIVRKVTEECYKNLVSTLEHSKTGKITLNISAVLTEQLVRYGYSGVIEGLGRLAERGQIEFTASAMYHPILPLIPGSEVRRQIELNMKINRRYFGDIYKPAGFFPPEMCYSFDVAKIVAEFGFSWIIVDEIACQGKVGVAKDDTIYRINGLKEFGVFFKERPFSAGLTYGTYPDKRSFINALADRINRHCYLLSGTDGEIYGHHRPGQEKLLQEVFDEGSPQTCTISELSQLFSAGDTAFPLPSSWSAWEDEMDRGIPYPQWSYPGNEIHTMQWQLTDLAIQLVHQLPESSKHYSTVRLLLDEGLHSCQYWWASCRPWWDTGMIEAGAKKLFEAVQTMREYLSKDQLTKAGTIYNSLITATRNWQESGKAWKLKQQYLNEHSTVSSELTFGQSQENS